MPFNKDAWGSSQYERNLQIGFNVGGPSLIDIRLVLSKEMMETTDDSVMPPKYFALCKENNQIYYYDKSLPRITNDPSEVSIGKFRRTNIQISDIQDQYGNSLLNDNHVAEILTVKKLSELINDSDSEGNVFVTDDNFKEYLDKFSTSEEDIFANVARTGSYNDLLDLPFIPDQAIYVHYTDPNGIFDELNSGTGNQDITVKQALDAISKAFKEDDILPLYIETGTGDIGDTAHNVRIRADKREQDDKPEVVIKLNLKDLYNDADYITKAYVDSENHRQDVEIVKKQNKLLPEQNSRIVLSDSEDVTYINTYFEPIAYSGDYSDVQNKPVIHTSGSNFVTLKPGYYDDQGEPVNDLTSLLKEVDIKEYSPEYERLRVEVDSEGGIYNRLARVQNVDLPSKQNKLIAGNNITINGANISAKDTTYTAGYNVTLTNDSAGKPTVINSTDTRYYKGNDNITITEITSDSKGKKFNISAKDTTYIAGTGIQVNHVDGDQYAIAAAIDGSSIIWDGTKLHANAVGQYGATPPIIANNTGTIGNIKLDYDAKTLVYDSTNKLRVKHDNQTIKYDASNGLYVPIDNSTLKYDTASGKIKWPYSNGDGISLDGGIIKVKFDTSTGAGGHAGEFGVNSNGGIYLNHGSSLFIDSTTGKLEAAGKVKLVNSDAIKAIETGTNGAYRLEPVIGDLSNPNGSTLKINTTGTYKGLVGNYQGGTGIAISGNIINHTNSITGISNPLGSVSNSKVTMPSIKYDNQGHINGASGVTFYAPATAGTDHQYLRSMSGTVGWMTFDSAPANGSKNGISSGAVYTALQSKQNKLTSGSYININNNVIKSTLVAGDGINITQDNANYKINATVDNKTIKVMNGALTVTSGAPIIYRLNLPTTGWSTKTGNSGTYYEFIATNFVTASGATVPISNVLDINTVPLLTLFETSGDDAISKYIQWSKVYYVDVLYTTNNKPRIHFLSYEIPSTQLVLNCALMRVQAGQ